MEFKIEPDIGKIKANLPKPETVESPLLDVPYIDAENGGFKTIRFSKINVYNKNIGDHLVWWML